MWSRRPKTSPSKPPKALAPRRGLSGQSIARGDDVAAAADDWFTSDQPVDDDIVPDPPEGAADPVAGGDPIASAEDSGLARLAAGQAVRTGPSLKIRGVKLLAQREHSRIELRRKLAPHAESAEELDATLDALEAGNYLSTDRFVQSVVQRRSSRFGVRRITQELNQHRIGNDDSAPALDDLRATEQARALAIWQRRFGAVPTDAAERARQQRFFMQRGFEGDTIRWLFRTGIHQTDE